MASFTITDLPRELTEDEARLMTETCADLFRRFEWLRTMPAHICKRHKGGGTCHDCGRALHRQEGDRPDGWCCPRVHRHALKTSLPNAAVECGGAD